MAEIEKQNSQNNTSKSQNIRRSQRPKMPSLLYGDNFEDTQKVVKKPAPKSAQRKVNSELASLIEKEQDNRSDDETAIDNLIQSPNSIDQFDDEYLPFVLPSGSNANSGSNHVKYVSFKCQVVEDERALQIGNSDKQVYSTRKVRRKPAYHDDYAFTTDARTLKVRPKSLPRKKDKTSSKTSKQSGGQDFLDVILSAALKAQAKQTGGDSSLNLKSPQLSDDSSEDSPKLPEFKSYNSTGKASAPKFSVFDEKENSSFKKKLSVKKEISTRSSVNEIDLNQRRLEYQDHYISNVLKKEDEIILNHTKNHPIVMKYQKTKFPVKNKSMLSSKIFELPLKEEFSVLSGTTGDSDGEWQKKLKIKENIMALHFKEVLQNYKPGILI